MATTSRVEKLEMRKLMAQLPDVVKMNQLKVNSPADKRGILYVNRTKVWDGPKGTRERKGSIIEAKLGAGKLENVILETKRFRETFEALKLHI